MSNFGPSNESLGFILSTHYEIIKQCVRNLPNESLPQAAAVCKAWHNVVKEVRKSRTQIQCHFKKNRKLSLRKSDERHQIKGINYIQDSMKSVKGLGPKLCIAFCSQGLQQSYYKIKSSAARKMHEELRNCLPPDCFSMVAVSEGIVGYQNDIQSIEVALQKHECFAAVTLPDMPTDIKVEFFRRTSSRSDFEICDNGQFVPMSKDADVEPVKCAILLTTCHCNAADELYDIIKRRQSKDFAMGGCVVQSLSMPSCTSVVQSASEDQCDSVKFSGILFSGEKLKAASVILSPDDEDEVTIRDRLMQLKSSVFPFEKSLAFAFSCIGRSFDLDIEMSLFHSIFPTTPLLGLVGNGEIGLDYVTGLQSSEETLKKRRLQLDHSYSTVVVLLGWD